MSHASALPVTQKHLARLSQVKSALQLGWPCKSRCRVISLRQTDIWGYEYVPHNTGDVIILLKI